MNKSEKLLQRLQERPLIALLNPQSVEDCVRAFEMLDPEGIGLEIAFRSEYAEEGISAVMEKYPKALLLAGTVMSAAQAESAVKLGAAGVVSADYIPDVVEICVRSDVMCVPGGLGDAGKQLVQKSELYGCSLEELRRRFPYQWIYKLFPAFAGNFQHLDFPSAWRGPFPGLKVIYTGGVNRDTLPLGLRKDPQGFFCASALTRNLSNPAKMKADIRLWISLVDSRKKTLEQSAPPVSPKPAGRPHQEPDRQPHSLRVVTFGEIMLRLSPHPGIRLSQTRRFDATFGGAEANVAVSLAHLGLQSVFVGALPPNDIGRNAAGLLKQHGVLTDSLVWKGERMGIYYLEHGAGPRPSKVVYDRAGSAASQIRPEDVDWGSILQNSDWFHWTGITPALSDSSLETLKKGLQAAKSRGIPVSADLNFRKKLWTEKKAGKVMHELMEYVDVCIGNEEDPIRIFGVLPHDSDVDKGKLEIGDYRRMAEELKSRFGFKQVAITLRESLSASENIWSACLYSGGHFYHSRKYRLWIVDRVGAGDAFAAALIYAMLERKKDPEALEFAVAAAALKHSLQGDFNPVSASEIERLAAGDLSGRIRR